jgi:hypothetical protein
MEFRKFETKSCHNLMRMYSYCTAIVQLLYSYCTAVTSKYNHTSIIELGTPTSLVLLYAVHNTGARWVAPVHP